MTTDSTLTFDQILDAARDGVITYVDAWDALGEPSALRDAARARVAAAINASQQAARAAGANQ